MFNEDLSGLKYTDLVNGVNSLKNILPDLTMTQNTQSQTGKNFYNNLLNARNTATGVVGNTAGNLVGYGAQGLDFITGGLTGGNSFDLTGKWDNVMDNWNQEMLSKRQLVPSATQLASSQLTPNKGNQNSNPTGAIQSAVNSIQKIRAIDNDIEKQNPAIFQPNQPQNSFSQPFDINMKYQSPQPQFSQVQQDLMMYDAKDKQDLAKRQQDWADFMMARSAKAKTKSGAANYANLAGIGLNQAQKTQAGADAINQLRNQFNQQIGLGVLNNQQAQQHAQRDYLQKLSLLEADAKFKQQYSQPKQQKLKDNFLPFKLADGSEVYKDLTTGEIISASNQGQQAQTQVSQEFIDNLRNGYANAKTEQERQAILQVAKSKGISF